MSRATRAAELIYNGLRNPEEIPSFLTGRFLDRYARYFPNQVRFYLTYDNATFHTKVGSFQTKVPKNTYYTKRSPEEYEPQVVECLSAKLTPNSVFYDIGSYFGYYVNIANLCGVSNSNIHAFEQDSFKCFTIEQNCGEEVTVNNTRVGRNHNENEISIDEYSKTHDSPDVMKIDVEGAEYPILQGAKDTLREHQPVLLIEVHTFMADFTDSDIINMIRSEGYSVGTVLHQMFRTNEERSINWLTNEDTEPILKGEDTNNKPYLLAAFPQELSQAEE